MTLSDVIFTLIRIISCFAEQGMQAVHDLFTGEILFCASLSTEHGWNDENDAKRKNDLLVDRL